MKALHKRHWLLLAMAIMLLPISTKAQRRSSYHGYFDPYNSRNLSRISVSLGVGNMALHSDLNKLTDQAYQNNFLNGQINAGVAFRLTNFISLRFEGGYYSVYSKPNVNVYQHAIGRASVSSGNFDGYTALVHDFVPKFKNEGAAPPWNLYAFVGIGATMFNPKDAETKQELRPLNNNSLDTPYGKVAQIYPVGLGFEYHTTENGSVCLEASYRFTNTDFLDDMQWSAIEGISDNDGYAMLSLKYKHTFLMKKRYGR